MIGGWADVYFVYAMGPRIKAYAKRHASGSTFLEISAKQLAKADLCLPSLPEQRAVGALFSRLDSLIALHQRKLEKLRALKQSLLQKMFV